MEKNLTTGSVFKNVVWFSLPYLLSYFLQTLYGMADLFIIGQYDKVASTTAVSVGSQIMHMITVMIVGLAMGTTVNIAQAIGANDKKQAAKAIGTTISQAISVLVSLIVIVKRKSVVLGKTDFKPHRVIMRKLLSIGIPIAVQDGLIQVAFIVITIIANRRGLNDAAAVGIVEKIISFLFLVPSSMLSTVSALGA